MYFPSSLFLRCFSLGLLLLSALHTKAQLQASSTSTPVTCYQASDGSIDLQVSGGASPYTYSWNNGATTEDLNNLSGGIYSVTVRDAFGALVVHTDTVAAPNGPLSVTTSTSSVDTSNQTGTLSLSVTGGVVPYSYTLNGGAVQSIASQPVLWDQGQFGPSGWWQFNALATDGQGNIYGTGYIWDTVVIDGQTVPRVDPSKNGTDLLFAKFDAQYNLLWYKTAGTTNSAFSSSSNDVSVDNQGNAYVVGSFRDTLYWDTLTLVAQGTSDGFLAKYSPAGDLLWVQTVAGKSDDVVNAIETDDLGNSYITGTFRDSTTLGGDKLYSVGFRDIFVAKFDPTGNKVWGFSGGTTSFDDSRTLCFDPNGDLILAPRMPGSGSIQGNAFSFSASRHILVKVSANGSVQWMEPFSPSTSISLSLNDLATDPAGNIYATGSFGSTLVIGNSTFVNAGPQDFFLAKFSPTGTGLWANIGYTNTTSGLSNVGNEVLVDGSGAIYVAGQAYTGQNIFPSVPQDFTFTSTGQNDAFVVKYNTDGNIIWLKHAMGGGNTDGEGLAIDANGIHLGGGFAGTMTLDGTNYTSSSYSGFLARIDQSQESNLPNLGFGNYQVVVTDANGCTVQVNPNISAADVTFAVQLNAQSPACINGTDGILATQALNGMAPYTYAWSNGANTSLITNLGAGTYSVTVTDQQGATAVATEVLNGPNSSLNITSVVTPTYSQVSADGAIDLTVIGAPAGTKSTVTTSTTNGFNSSYGINGAGLLFDVNQYFILDSVDVYSNGNTVLELELQGPSGNLLEAKTVILSLGWNRIDVGWGISPGSGYRLVRGFGSTGGYGTTSSSGVYPVSDTEGVMTIVRAEPNYSRYMYFYNWVLTVPEPAFQWSNGEGIEDIEALTAGQYSVTVTSQNVCLVSQINVPAGNGVYLTHTTTDLNCFGEANGAIDLEVLGGASPYTYAWSNGSAQEDLSGLTNGTYSVTVTDSIGDSVITQFDVNEPGGALELRGTTSPVTCTNPYGQLSIEVAGGTGPFNYSVNGGAPQTLSGTQVLFDQVLAGVDGSWRTEDIQVDPQGDFWVTGSFRGTIVIDGQTFTSPSVVGYSEAYYVAKFDADFNLLWFKNGGGGGSNSKGLALALDAAGNAFVVGRFTDTVQFEGASGQLISNGGYDQFVISYTSSGAVRFVKRFGGVNGDEGQAVVVDGSGNFYLAGTFRGPVTFGNVTLNPSGFSNVNLVKFNNIGSVQWALRTGGVQSASVFTLGIDPNGDIVVPFYGRKSGSLSFGGMTASPIYGRFVMAKVSPAGNPIWVKSFEGGNDGSTYSRGIGFDAAGDIYITGNFDDDIVVGGKTETPRGNIDMFLARFDNNGNGKWVTSAGVSSAFGCSGRDLYTDANGNSYVTGTMAQGLAVFRSKPTNFSIIPTGQADGFVAKYNADGNVTWLKHAVGGGNSDAEGLIVSQGKIYSCGGYAGTLNIEGTNYTSNAFSGYLARINETLQDTIDSLPAGPVQVVVTDANGCSATLSESVGNNDLFSISLAGSTASCPGAANGIATVIPANGLAPFTYQWSSGDTTDTAFSLSAGTYTVTVTDATGCVRTDAAVVLDPPAIQLTFMPNLPSLAGAADGSLEVAVTLGAAPFTYQWSNGSMGNPNTGLVSGTYTVTVTDSNGCTVVGSDSLGDGVIIQTTQVTSIFCGDTLLTMDTWLPYPSVPGATNYRYRFSNSGGALVYTRGYAAGNFRVSQVQGLQFNTTYQVQVATLVNGVWSNYGPECVLTTPGNLPTPNLLPAYCGITVNSLSDWLYITTISGADNYRYEVTGPNGFLQTYTRGYQWTNFRMDFIQGLQINTTYTVRVAASFNGVWGNYGAPCTVATPAAIPTTQLASSSCNITLSSLNQYLYVQAVPGADNYRFEVTAPGFSYVLTRGWAASNFLLSQIPGISFNTTYAVRVAASINGTWGGYGSSCNVTTPSSVPTVQLLSVNCDVTVPTWNTYVFYETVGGATRYRLEFMAPGFSTTYIRPGSSNLFRLDWVPGLQANTTYAVRVAPEIGGTFGAYGTSCDLTSPSTPATRLGFFDTTPDASNEATKGFIVYPNPNTGSFLVEGDWQTDLPVELTILDLNGRRVFFKQVMQPVPNQRIELETELSSGMYLLQTTQGSEQILQRLVIY